MGEGIGILYAILGLLAGGFLNLCCERLPNRETLLEPPHCSYCGRVRGPLRWLAVLGYMFGRGHCRSCGAPIPLRSVALEILTTSAFAFLWRKIGPSPKLFFLTIYTSIFILVTFIDLEHRLIPNIVIYPAISLALFGGFVDNYRLALLGGAIGFFSAFLFYLLGRFFVVIAERLGASRIKEVPFGPGDVKLAAFIGLVVGFPGIIFALILGVLVGGVGAGLFLLFGRPLSPFTPIPYGPFLSIGGFTMMIYGQELIKWYLGAF